MTDIVIAAGKKRITLNWRTPEVRLLIVASRRDELRKDVDRLIMTEGFRERSCFPRAVLLLSVKRILDYLYASQAILPFAYGVSYTLDTGQNSSKCGEGMLGGVRIGRELFNIETGFGKCDLIRIKVHRKGHAKEVDRKDIRLVQKLQIDGWGELFGPMEIKILRKKLDLKLLHDLEKLRRFLSSSRARLVEVFIEE